MARMTRDQLNKFNANCKNGFSLDLYFFAVWGEKRCKRNIQIAGDSNIYEIIIEFVEESKNFAKLGNKPIMIINKCVQTGTKDMYSVHRIYDQVLGEMVQRKSIKILQEFTNDYPEEKLLEMIGNLIAA